MFSFSLEGLTGGAGVGNKPSSSLDVNSANTKELRHPFSGEARGDSLMSLSEEDLESGQREHRMFDQQVRLKRVYAAHLEKLTVLPYMCLHVRNKESKTYVTMRLVIMIAYPRSSTPHLAQSKVLALN